MVCAEGAPAGPSHSRQALGENAPVRARTGEILLAAGATALGLLLLLAAEGLLRRWDPGYVERRRNNAVDRLHAYSEAYGWAPRPGAHAIENGAPTQINAAGYRGPLVAARPGPRRRVVLLGDSTAFGYGVRDEETYARLLEGLAAVEVVNLGVEGFGPDQSLLRLEREGLPLEPAEVLMSLCLENDFADAALPVFLYDGRHPKPWFALEGDGLALQADHLRLSPVARLGLWLSERSQLYLRLSSALAPRPGRGEPWRQRRDRALADAGAAVERVARLLLRQRDVAAARGARYTLLLQPGKESYNRGSELAERLRARLEPAGVALLDLAAAHRAAGRRFADFAFDPTGHLSAAGHAAVAGAIRDHWARRDAPPSS